MVSIKCLLKHQILTQYVFLKKTLQKLISEMNYLIMFNFISNGKNSRVMYLFLVLTNITESTIRI